MHPHDVTLFDRLPDEIATLVESGHDTYETSHSIRCDYKPFSLALRDEAGAVTGVLSAYTAYAEIYVDDLWVAEEARGKGYGRVLLEALEARFSGEGYNNINLVTSAFQAVGFYQAGGFEVEFVRVNKANPKLTKTFFIKYFQEAGQHQGIL
jgi:GNAT superfamily N-acetyltransferase